MVPREHSSGGKQRVGGISKQGNRLLRFLLVEAANIAVRFDPEFAKRISAPLPSKTLHRRQGGDGS
jgi:transposase